MDLSTCILFICSSHPKRKVWNARLRSGISVWKRWVFSCLKLFRTRFSLHLDKSLEFRIDIPSNHETGVLLAGWHVRRNIHPVLLQVLIYRQDLYCLSHQIQTTVYLIYVLSAFLWINLFFPRFPIPKRKKVAEFLTLGISHPSSIWSLSPKAVVPQHLGKNGRKVQKVDSHPPQKHTVPLKFTIKAPENGCLEYYCSCLVSFWGVLPMFRGKLLFLSFSMFQCTYKKMTTDLGHPDSFRECCTFFLSSNGCSLKNPLKEAVNSVGEVKWRVSKLEIKTVAFSSKRPEWAHATTRFGDHPSTKKVTDQALDSPSELMEPLQLSSQNCRSSIPAPKKNSKIIRV